LLEPAFGAGYAGGVVAVGGAEFGDGFGQVVAHGSFGEVKFGGYVGSGAAIAGALEDLAFAVGERIRLGVPGLGCESGIDNTKTAMDTAHGFGELFCGTVFEEIAASASVHGSAEIAGAGEGGKNDGADVGVVGVEDGGEFEAGHLGHLDVGHEDVGGEAADGVECFAAVGAGGDDDDVGFEVEESGESAEDHGLVFGEGDADGGAWAHWATQGAFSCAVAGCGSSMSKVTPGSVVMESRPPRDWTRSRMPRRPLPSWSFGGAPSSAMRRVWNPSGDVAKRMLQ